MNIALGLLNLLQTGDTAIPYVVQTGGATRLDGFPDTGTGVNGITVALRPMPWDKAMGTCSKNRTLESVWGVSRRPSTSMRRPMPSVLAMWFSPMKSLSNQLRMVARTIGARSTLQSSRQIFFVSVGGWDNHADLVTAQNTSLPRVSQALKAFYDAMTVLGVQRRSHLYLLRLCTHADLQWHRK